MKLVKQIDVLSSFSPSALLVKLNDMGETTTVSSLECCWSNFESGSLKSRLALVQYVIDHTWEKLNIGHWKDVDMIWRHAYYVASVIKAALLFELGLRKESLKSCDMGLLLGAPISTNVLRLIASKLSIDILHNKHKSNQESESNSEICKEITLSEKPIDGTRSSKDIQVDDKFQSKRRKVSCGATPHCSIIDSIPAPSLVTFKQTYMDKEKPVVIKNAASDWPAFCERRWSIEYIRQVAGQRTVPVELGTKYTSDDWTQTLITVNEFVDKYILNGHNLEKKGYLAQHELFEQISELRDDIIIPDYCCLSSSDDDKVLINAWFGPEGTVSPLHHDPYHNLLVQVVGEKLIRLYDRQETDNLYPHNSPLLDNTSQVDVEHCDHEKFPNFADAPYFECILKEGEMLYIPPKWWHYVRSKSISFSVSFWWV